MKFETVTLLTPRIRFLMFMLCPMSFIPSSLESGREGRVYFCHSPWTYIPKQVGIFAWNLNHADKTSLETFWHTQVWNLRHMASTIVLDFFKHFAVIFAKFFLYSIKQAIKTKYVLFELKVPWPTNAISETYNRAHTIVELVDILPNVFFTTSETELDYY